MQNQRTGPSSEEIATGSASREDNASNATTSASEPNAGDSAGPGSKQTPQTNPDSSSNDKGGGSQHSQKRRLNQACLLCRRKKIRCDSNHPSCANCQRRGIQCIYPEVRKRGRPPRMYTFADFALPGQPLPPEVQHLVNTNASAMLPSTGGQAQNPGQGVAAHGSNPMYSWNPSGAAGGPQPAYPHGPSGAGTDMSGASTPAHAPGDYEVSPALPPLSVAVGRGGSGGSGGPAHPHLARGPVDPMMLPTPPLGVDQAVLDLFEYIIPGFPIVHRQTLVQNIRDRSLTLPLWLAIHAVSARFESDNGSQQLRCQNQHQHHQRQHAFGAQKFSSSMLGAGYAEKAHAMLVNRFGHRQPRPQWSRNERGRMVVTRDAESDVGGLGMDMSRRELIELLQSHILLSIYYAGNWELDLAVETHAAAVRIAQRMGVHLIDDPSKLQDISGIFNPSAAVHQRKRALSWTPPTNGSSSRWRSMHAAEGNGPPPLPGGPNDIEMHENGNSSSHEGSPSANTLAPADLRKQWIEFETLRRLWWSMYILDRMYYLSAGSPRMILISGFKVRLPCSDLEWDSIHAQPASTSPNASAAMPDTSQPAGLMVRTFREAVMHTSMPEKANSEIAATPSKDPNIYRYFAALAGLIDSVVDFGEDIRALVSPPLMEGTELFAQLRADSIDSEYSPAAMDGPGSSTSAYGRYGITHLGAGPGSSSANAKQASTSIWLGSKRSRHQFAKTSRSGWHSSSTSSIWPPDWRSRMRALQERVAALEAQFTEWYSSLPIAQYVRKPYLYSQLPLQDRITYFHQQIVYYGGVIQLQSLVVMTQGLLLPDSVDDELPTFGFPSSGSPDAAKLGLGPSGLTSMLWRLLMDMDVNKQFAADFKFRRHLSDAKEPFEPSYSSRRRQYGANAGWPPRRQYGGRGSISGADSALLGDGADGEGDMPLLPLDADGNSPEIIREELQRMVQAAWRRCTEAAIAMSTAVKRATEVRRVASMNPNTSYYDPTFKPQVLPPYRGDAAISERHSPMYGDRRGSLGPNASSRYDRVPFAGEMRASPQQPPPSNMAMQTHNPAEPGSLRTHVDHRDMPQNAHSHYQSQQHQGSSPNAHAAHNAGIFNDSAAGPGQVIDDATFFTRFNMFTCSAAYIGACIHLQNMKLTPRWEEALRLHNEAVSKANEMRMPQGTGSSMGGAEAREMGLLSDPQDVGALPPPMPAPLPPPPCTPAQAREGVKPLLKILEGISPYWRVSGHVDKIRKAWRAVEGYDLPQPSDAGSGSTGSGMPAISAPASSSVPVPTSAQESGYWMHSQPLSQQQQQQQQPLLQSHHLLSPPALTRQPIPPNSSDPHSMQPKSRSPLQPHTVPPAPPMHSQSSNMSIAALSSDHQHPQGAAMIAPPPQSVSHTQHKQLGMPPP
ncbi:hypothetical protein GGI12_001663 [Dipsacomyces acuminosporus]|nr:hypothetical protein GGI12_001663 [Dipsacomyces acuminosporus]